MVELVYLAGISLVAAGAGRKVLCLFRINFSTPGEEAIFSIGLGYGVMSYLVFGLGVARLLYRPAIYGLVTLLAILSWRDIRYFLAHRALRARLVSWFREQGFSFLGGLLLASAVFNLVGTLAPITSADALSYHFAGPKLSLHSHRLAEVPGNWLSYMPFNIEMLFLMGMGLYRDTLGALFHWWFAVLSAVALWAFSKKHFEETDPLLVAAIFYVSAFVAWESTSGYIDLGLAFFTLMAVYAFFNGKQEMQAGKWLTLSGVFGGFAAGSKYTGGLVPFLMFLLLAAWHVREKKPLAGLGRLARFALPVVILVFPWYLRNYILTGDPVFPFLTAWLGNSKYRSDLTWVSADAGYGKSLLDLLAIPFRMVLEGEQTDNGQFLGPLYLCFLPFSWLCMKANRGVRVLWYLIIADGLIWFYTTQQARFLLPLMPLAAVCCGLSIRLLARQGAALRAVTRAVVLAALSFAFLATVVYDAQFVPVVFGLESKDHFLKKKTWFYRDVQWMNQNLPKNARVLFGGWEGYYLDREYYLWLLEPEEPEVGKWLAQHHVSYIYCVDEECGPLLASGLPFKVLKKEDREVIGSRTLGGIWRKNNRVSTAVLELQN